MTHLRRTDITGVSSLCNQTRIFTWMLVLAFLIFLRIFRRGQKIVQNRAKKVECVLKMNHVYFCWDYGFKESLWKIMVKSRQFPSRKSRENLKLANPWHTWDVQIKQIFFSVVQANKNCDIDVASSRFLNFFLRILEVGPAFFQKNFFMNWNFIFRKKSWKIDKWI